jgi:hypothetical protein
MLALTSLYNLRVCFTLLSFTDLEPPLCLPSADPPSSPTWLVPTVPCFQPHLLQAIQVSLKARIGDSGARFQHTDCVAMVKDFVPTRVLIV